MCALLRDDAAAQADETSGHCGDDDGEWSQRRASCRAESSGFCGSTSFEAHLSLRLGLENEHKNQVLSQRLYDEQQDLARMRAGARKATASERKMGRACVNQFARRDDRRLDECRRLVTLGEGGGCGHKMAIKFLEALRSPPLLNATACHSPSANVRQ